MRKVVICLLVIFFCTSFNHAFCEVVQKAIEGINRNQPISPGEIVYEENLKVLHDSSYAFYHIKYTYIGFDIDGIRIRYNSIIDDPARKERVIKETKILFLPLDVYGRTYLEMPEVPRWPQKIIVPAKRLDIELADRTNFRIFVEEANKPQ